MKKRPARRTHRGGAAKTATVATRETNGSEARPVVPLKERRLAYGNKWDYAPAPEACDYVQVPPRHELFINGQFITPRSGKYFDSINRSEEHTSELQSR